MRRYGGRRGYKIQILDREWKIGSLFYFVVEIKLAWMPLAPPTTVFPNIFVGGPNQAKIVCLRDEI